MEKQQKIWIGTIEFDVYMKAREVNDLWLRIHISELNKKTIDNIVDIVNKVRENATNYAEGIRKVTSTVVVELVSKCFIDQKEVEIFELRAEYDKELNEVDVFLTQYMEE